MLPRRFDRGSGYGGQQSGYDGDSARRDGGDSLYRGQRETEYYDYQRRRSPSPRRDDRRVFGDKDSSWDSRSKGRDSGSNDWQDDRGRNRHSRTPPTQRAGLLGAGPGDMPQSNIGGQAGVSTQVLAALQAQQTQAWLAALQANQVQMNSSSNHQSGGGNFNNRNNQGRQTGQRQWNNTNRKRFGGYQEPNAPYQKRKRDDYKPANRPYGRDPQKKFPSKSPSAKESKSNDYNPAEPTCDNDSGKTTKALILSELCDQVEELRKREKIERNISDQDVDKLVLFSFNGQVHKCDVCKIMCKSAAGLKQHLVAKKHSLAVIEERAEGKDPCRDIMDIDLKPDDWFEKNEVARILLEKQATALELARQEQRKKEFEANPANYIGYSVNTRKVATKKDSTVLLTQASEVTVRINDFAKDQPMFGCEFINTVVGFNCQLCKVLLNRDESVIEHIQSRQHKENYKNYTDENKDYEATQAANNNKLNSALTRHESKRVLLHEAFECDEGLYLTKDDPEVVNTDSDMPSWCEVGSLVEKPQEASEDECNASGEPETGDGADAADASDKDEEIDEDEMLGGTQGTEEQSDDDDDITNSTPAEDEPASASVKEEQKPSIAASTVDVKEESVPSAEQEDPVTKETTPTSRMQGRRAARGAGAQARRGRGRGGTAKVKTYKVRVTPAKSDVMDSAVTEDYEVIDEVQL